MNPLNNAEHFEHSAATFWNGTVQFKHSPTAIESIIFSKFYFIHFLRYDACHTLIGRLTFFSLCNRIDWFKLIFDITKFSERLPFVYLCEMESSAKQSTEAFNRCVQSLRQEKHDFLFTFAIGFAFNNIKQTN